MRKSKIEVAEVSARDIIDVAPGHYFDHDTMQGYGTRTACTAYAGRGTLFLALHNRRNESCAPGYRVCAVTVASLDPLVITRCGTVQNTPDFTNMRQCRAAARRLAIATLEEVPPCTQ